MKRFLLNFIIFISFVIIIVFLSGELLYYLINRNGFNFLNNADYKVTESIIRSRKHKKTKKLLLGDSVASSLYGDCQDSCVYSLAATVAITSVGHYLLCENFFENNRDSLPEEVILVLNPLCWTNKMEGGLFYSTFIKNFYNSEFKEYLDKEEIDYIDGESYSWLCNQRWYQLSPYIPKLQQSQPNEKGIATIQYKYLIKIKEKCESHGVKFRLLSGPVRTSLKKIVDDVKKSNMHFDEPLFIEYFSSIKYIDDGAYLDQLHLKPEFVPNDYLELYK